MSFSCRHTPYVIWRSVSIFDTTLSKQIQETTTATSPQRIAAPGHGVRNTSIICFANAGISFFNISIETLQTSIIFGILISLFIGKQFGIFGISWAAVKLGIAHLPEQVRWLELYAIAIICGIGFTISLFIGALAFGDINNSYLDSVKIGVLSGSLLSGLFGYLLLFFTKRQYRSR